MAECTTIHVPLRDRAYDLRIGDRLLADADATALAPLAGGRRCLLVSDSNVAPLYGTAATALLRAAGASRVETVVIPAGEGSKVLATMSTLYTAAARAGVDRRGLIVSLGGGVVTDLSGFLAATWMRGVDYAQLPTSLLAQVDSAVGGKTGVDLPEGKNLVGAFHQPRLVLLDVSTLRSLPPRELRCGLAEVVKYGVILDAELFARLEQNRKALLRADPVFYREVVRRSCELKVQVVVEDEFDTTGCRALLNYGHTFGHALETLGGYSTYLHGEAVAIGMGMAADLALLLEDTADRREVRDRQDALLAALGLPLQARGLDAAAVQQAMQSDKKFVGGRSRVILPERLGEVRQFADVPAEAVRRAIAGRLV